MLDYVVRPIEAWPGEQTKTPVRSRFDTPHNETLRLLERELNHLRARTVVVQAFVTESDLRNDGMIRANARPRRPGIVLSFESKHGPLSYPCDTFDRWEDNLRAIALSLEALRSVDRYGVTKRAEQYTGWKRLGGGTASPGGSTMSPVKAAWVLHDLAAEAEPCAAPEMLLRSADARKAAWKNCARRFHPDAEFANPDKFKTAKEAYDLLEKEPTP